MHNRLRQNFFRAGQAHGGVIRDAANRFSSQRSGGCDLDWGCEPCLVNWFHSAWLYLGTIPFQPMGNSGKAGSGEVFRRTITYRFGSELKSKSSVFDRSTLVNASGR